MGGAEKRGVSGVAVAVHVRKCLIIKNSSWEKVESDLKSRDWDWDWDCEIFSLKSKAEFMCVSVSHFEHLIIQN